ncbi:GL24022 [Drosophila persimilis]|uniref:GL24022 n=1 Tax=Drosophila persimilis TaxID=7234 RepID=B4IR83_DROPE|nr:GL24022 [Drosophila persimilis]
MVSRREDNRLSDLESCVTKVRRSSSQFKIGEGRLSRGYAELAVVSLTLSPNCIPVHVLFSVWL